MCSQGEAHSDDIVLSTESDEDIDIDEILDAMPPEPAAHVDTPARLGRASGLDLSNSASVVDEFEAQKVLADADEDGKGSDGKMGYDYDYKFELSASDSVEHAADVEDVSVDGDVMDLYDVDRHRDHQKGDDERALLLERDEGSQDVLLELSDDLGILSDDDEAIGILGDEDEDVIVPELTDAELDAVLADVEADIHSARGQDLGQSDEGLHTVDVLLADDEDVEIVQPSFANEGSFVDDETSTNIGRFVEHHAAPQGDSFDVSAYMQAQQREHIGSVGDSKSAIAKPSDLSPPRGSVEQLRAERLGGRRVDSGPNLSPFKIPGLPSFADTIATRSTALNFGVGDVVDVRGQIGTVRYIGSTHKPGVWVGVEMDEPVGFSNGNIHGVHYFTCPDRHAKFVKPSSVTPLQHRG